MSGAFRPTTSRTPPREIRIAAGDLAYLLTIARAYLASFRPCVCATCGHVFSRDLRLDMRCPDCAARSEVLND